MVMIWVHHRSSPRKVRQEVNTCWPRAKLPSLGVVPVSCQCGMTDQIAGLRRCGQDLPRSRGLCCHVVRRCHLPPSEPRSTPQCHRSTADQQPPAAHRHNVTSARRNNMPSGKAKAAKVPMPSMVKASTKAQPATGMVQASPATRAPKQAKANLPARPAGIFLPTASHSATPSTKDPGA